MSFSYREKDVVLHNDRVITAAELYAVFRTLSIEFLLIAAQAKLGLQQLGSSPQCGPTLPRHGGWAKLRQDTGWC